MSLTPEQLAELNNLTLEQIRLKKEANAFNDEELAHLDSVIARRREDQQYLMKTNAELLAYQEKLSGIGNTLDANLLKRQVARDLMENELQLLQAELKTKETITAEDLAAVAALEERLEVQDEILGVQEEMNKNMRQQTSLVQAASKAGMKLGLAFQDSTLILGELNVGFQKLGGMLTGKFIDGMVGMITSFDEASKAFETQYAMGQKYEEQLGLIYGEQAQLGVSMEELTKGTGDLIDNFTDFTMLLPQQREELIKTATVMQESYGVATADFSKGIQSSTKMLGMSVGRAREFQGELSETAKAIGVAPAQLSAQFAQMGPQIAKFGHQGGKAFKELARVQKITGMEMEKVLAITNKFDTFEGAAEQAGQLNAALGGNFVNAMDLMMATDPAERFGMIRDAILDTGLTFDDMSYYQKQFYTNSLGLSDVGDLALMLSGNMDNLAGSGQKTAKQYEEQAKRAKDLMTIQETLKSIFLESAPAVENIANALAWVARLLADNAKVVMVLTGAYVAYQAILAAVAIKKGFMAAKETLFGVSRTKELALIKTTTAAIHRQTNAYDRLDTVKKKSNITPSPAAGAAAGGMATAATIAAIGVALLGLGVGFMAAGKGVAFMAEAMQDMSIGQIIAMGVPIAALGLSFKGLALGLAAVTVPAGAASPPLLALGAAIVLIGGGIGLAAAGIGLMAEGMAKLFDAISFEKLISLGGFLAAAAFGSAGLIAAGVGLGAMAVGMGLLSLALWSISTDDLEAIATFTESLASVTTSQMKELADTIKAVAKAMDDIPVKKAMVFDTIMKQTAITAATVSRANASPGAAAASTTNNMSRTNTGNRGKIGEVLIKFDTDLFENKVISIYEEQDGLSAQAEAYGTSPRR